MKASTRSQRIWWSLFDAELIIATIYYLLVGINRNRAGFITAGLMLALLILNHYLKQTKYFKYFVYLNIWLIPGQLCDVWVGSGNYFLAHFASLSVLIIWVWWLVWLVLLLPLVMTSVSRVHNWILRLLVFNYFLDIQYGPDAKLKIKNLPLMHTLNDQGVISAIALLILVCFMLYSWGYRFNPNLKFIRSKYFKWSVFTALLVLLLIDIWWNDFGDVGNNLWQILFGFDIDIQPKYFTWPNFTSALEPGILEEVERYANVMILLIAFQNKRQWRIPIAVYGSTLIFALSHLDNIGYHGQSVMASVSQAIGVTDAMIWAIAFLYIGKLWLPMLAHFLLDYLVNLQSGWTSNWPWSGSIGDWVSTFIPLIFGLAVTIWMMYGQRRQVMEENVDRLLLKRSENEDIYAL